jgi:parallel beta-helix repeat protein
VVLRGFGVRRYATSLPLMGMVTIERPGGIVENLIVENGASIGLGIYDRNARVNRVTSRRNGLMGMGANTAYGLKILSSLVEDNNSERFNMAPAAGGVKITKARNIEVRNSRFTGNRGTALWFDQSNYGATVVGNEMSNNHNHGLFYEISSTGVFADNLVLRNKGFGFKINNADNLDIWNNTFVGNDRPINLVQDTRRNNDSSLEGKDRQRPNPDPTVPWVLRNIRVHNNVIRQGSGNCLVCVEDYSGQMAADQMALSFRGNVYNRPDGSPAWFAVWSGGPGRTAVFTALPEFRRATRQDAGSVLYDNRAVVATGGSIPRTVRSAARPAPLTSAVARAVGRAAGTAWSGVWLSR